MAEHLLVSPLGGVPVDYDTPDTRESSTSTGWGRCCLMIRSCSAMTAVKKVVATISLIGAGVITYISMNQLAVQSATATKLYSARMPLLCGAAIGACSTIALGLGVCSQPAKKIMDFIARWSFETLHVTTQLAENGFVPISGRGLWDTDNVPDNIRYRSDLFFGALAGSYLALSIRAISGKKEPSATFSINSALLSENIDPFRQKNRLFLEARTDEPKRFLAEQMIKFIGSGVLLGLVETGYLTAGEWRYLSYFLAGSTFGASSALAFHRLQKYIEAKFPVTSNDDGDDIYPWQTRAIRTIGKIAYFVSTPTLGALSVTHSPYSVIGFGFIASANKISALHTFELLESNPDRVYKIIDCQQASGCKIIRSCFQAALVGACLAWYGWGLSDSTNRWQDYTFIGSFIGTTLVSYPLTRLLIDKYDPQAASPALNTLYFYTVYHPSLFYPYFLRRFTGPLGDSARASSVSGMIQDETAWLSLAATWGSTRAITGVRNSDAHSPNEISSVVNISAGHILASGGTLA